MFAQDVVPPVSTWVDLKNENYKTQGGEEGAGCWVIITSIQLPMPRFSLFKLLPRWGFPSEEIFLSFRGDSSS